MSEYAKPAANIPLADVFFGLRFLRRVAEIEGLRVVGDLARLTPARLLKHRGAGPSLIRAVTVRLVQRYGLVLGQGLELADGGFAPALEDPPPIAAMGLRPYEDPSPGVYFVGCPPFIKVGRAARLRNRLSNLVTANPFALNVIGFVPCQNMPAAIELERALHRELGPFRHRGEWFHDCPEVRAVCDRALSSIAVDAR